MNAQFLLLPRYVFFQNAKSLTNCLILPLVSICFLFFLTKVDAQSYDPCYIMHGGPPVTGSSDCRIIVDCIITVSEEFVIEYGSDPDPVKRADEARAKASSVFSQATDRLQSAFLNEPNQIYDVGFRLVMVPDIVVKAGQTPNAALAENNIKDPIKWDLHIHFGTISHGQIGGGQVICNNPGGANLPTIPSIIYVGPRPNLLAHELIHYIGFQGHTDGYRLDSDPTNDFCGNCDGSAPVPNLMCTYGAGSGEFELGFCVSECIRSVLNQNNCECMKLSYPMWDPTFRPTSLISIASNSRPKLGCKDGMEYVDAEVTIFNPPGDPINPVPLEKEVRLGLWGLDAQLFELVPDDNFNTTIISANGTKFFLMIDANGDEVVHTLQPGEMKTIKVKLRLLMDPTALKDPHLVAFLGTNLSNANSFEQSKVIIRTPITINPTRSVTNFFDLIGSSAPIGQIHEYTKKDIYVKSGELKINLFLPFTPLTFNQVTFTMGSGSLLSVHGSSPDFLNVTFEGCDEMWKGIELHNSQSGDIKMTDCRISDAQIAIDQKSDWALMEITGSTFKNNDIGIRLKNGNGQIINENTFLKSGSFLKPFSGQTPLPQDYGFCGVQLKNYTGALSGNKFCNLQNGIIAISSNLTVEASLFKHMYFSTRTTGIQEPLFLPHSGIAIYSRGGQFQSLDGTMITAAHTGIYTQHSTATVQANQVSACNFGLKSFFSNITVTDSRIEASEVGITAMATLASIINNKIEVSGSSEVTGIRAGGDDYWLIGRAASISENIINAAGTHATGIHLPFSNGARLVKNTIILASSGSDKAAGIRLDGGYADLLQCNTITGSGEASIFSNMAAYPTLQCNMSSGTNKGIWFEGSSLGKFGAWVGGNKMSGHGTGLRLGDVAAIGEQRHRGNVFDGVNAISSNPDAGITSLFKVNAAHNPQFLPTFWDPTNWFVSEAFDGASFTCIDGVHCPLPSILPPLGKQEVVKVIENEGGESLSGQVQAWNAKVRLLQTLKTEPNPWPEEIKVTNFIANASAADIGAYAEMRKRINESIYSEEPNYQTIQTLLNQNQGLPVVFAWHLPEKQVNRVVLQTIGLNQEVNSEQKEQLLQVAGLCEQEYGEAVLRARSLLYLFDIPFEAAECSDGVSERSASQVLDLSSVQIQIAPNPVKDRLKGSIVLPFEHASFATLEVIDIYGQVRHAFRLSREVHHFDEDIHELEPGLYYLHVRATEKTRAVIKSLTIIK